MIITKRVAITPPIVNLSRLGHQNGNPQAVSSPAIGEIVNTGDLQFDDGDHSGFIMWLSHRFNSLPIGDDYFQYRIAPAELPWDAVVKAVRFRARARAREQEAFFVFRDGDRQDYSFEYEKKYPTDKENYPLGYVAYTGQQQVFAYIAFTAEVGDTGFAGYAGSVLDFVYRDYQSTAGAVGTPADWNGGGTITFYCNDSSGANYNYGAYQMTQAWVEIDYVRDWQPNIASGDIAAAEVRQRFIRRGQR